MGVRIAAAAAEATSYPHADSSSSTSVYVPVQGISDAAAGRERRMLHDRKV